MYSFLTIPLLGLINHIHSHHKKYVKKWEEQKAANDQLRASYNPIRKKNKKTDDGTKQQTLIGGNQGILQVEARHDAGAQKRFDEAPSNVLCNDNDSFQCTETRPFVCQSSVSQISRQNPDQDTQNNLQSHEEEGCWVAKNGSVFDPDREEEQPVVQLQLGHVQKQEQLQRDLLNCSFQDPR